MLRCPASILGELQKLFSAALGADSDSSNMLQSYARVLLASVLTASPEPRTPPLISSIIKILANCQGH